MRNLRYHIDNVLFRKLLSLIKVKYEPMLENDEEPTEDRQRLDFQSNPLARIPLKSTTPAACLFRWSILKDILWGVLSAVRC